MGDSLPTPCTPTDRPQHTARAAPGDRDPAPEPLPRFAPSVGTVIPLPRAEQASGGRGKGFSQGSAEGRMPGGVPAGAGTAITYSGASRPGDEVRDLLEPASKAPYTAQPHSLDRRRRAAALAVDREVTLEPHLSAPRGFTQGTQGQGAHTRRILSTCPTLGAAGAPPEPVPHLAGNSTFSSLFLPATTRRILPSLFPTPQDLLAPLRALPPRLHQHRNARKASS